MLKPSYKIEIGSLEITNDTPGPITNIDLLRSKNGAADEFCLSLGQVTELQVELGDAVSLSLGWYGETDPVFKGEVCEIRHGLTSMELTALGNQFKLMNRWQDTSYIDQKAGDVVSAMAAEAGVGIDSVEDGIVLPFYLADSGQSLFSHCLTLARRSGVDLYTTAEGKLVFATYSGARAEHRFVYGEHIIKAQVEKESAPKGVTVVPESPASSEGEETASWLVKDALAHAATAGDEVMVCSDPLLRTRESAQSAAESNLAAGQREAVHGEVVILGNAQVDLDQAVELAEQPESSMDGFYQVTAVRHLLSATTGFLTVISVGGIPDV